LHHRWWAERQSSVDLPLDKVLNICSSTAERSKRI
jgi:hypothetical protein